MPRRVAVHVAAVLVAGFLAATLAPGEEGAKSGQPAERAAGNDPKPAAPAAGAGQKAPGAEQPEAASPPKREWFQRRVGTEQNDARLVTPETERAIERALAWLAGEQRPEGSWGGTGFMQRGDTRVAMTALACLALVAGGNVPDSGPYGVQVRRGIDFLLSAQRPSGYISLEGDQSRIHGHGFATLMLAEIYGTVPDERLKQALNRAVAVVEKSQTPAGGWGYEPTPGIWDEASTTIAQVQALRSAREAGLVVDRKVIERAIEYVQKCAVPRDYKNLKGENAKGYYFCYSLAMARGKTSWALTAAAVSSLQGSGVYSGNVLEGGLGALFWEARKNDSKFRFTDEDHFWYAHFYAAQAMYHAPDPVYWETYYQKIRDSLLPRQARDGSWTDRDYGRPFATAIGALILQIPFKFLPIFQR
ncbi:MAG: terpene cyclase/mutase family protein [Planctomycetes bacterium]|nr:terpene cyclase/mutase family protein [Planctomycetota bacterium]